MIRIIWKLYIPLKVFVEIVLEKALQYLDQGMDWCSLVDNLLRSIHNHDVLQVKQQMLTFQLPEVLYALKSRNYLVGRYMDLYVCMQFSPDIQSNFPSWPGFGLTYGLEGALKGSLSSFTFWNSSSVRHFKMSSLLENPIIYIFVPLSSITPYLQLNKNKYVISAY